MSGLLAILRSTLRLRGMEKQEKAEWAEWAPNARRAGVVWACTARHGKEGHGLLVPKGKPCPKCGRSQDEARVSAHDYEGGSLMELGQFGHHPDHLIDAEIEVDRLQGLLAEAHGGLLRALDYRA